MLTSDHRASLEANGYVVVPAGVPERLLDAARKAICSFVDADLDRPETWYRHEPLEWSVVPVHHAQAFWDVRQWPTVYELFASLWQTRRLWVTMDRAVFKVPLSDAHPEHVDESILHWDSDPRTLGSRGYQGMLYLTNTAAGEGCFECAPSIYRELDQYLASHPGPLLERRVDVTGQNVIQVPVHSGDLVLWGTLLPHQGGRNHGPRPRLSLPISMYPQGTEAERLERIECWQQKRAPSWWRGWKGQIDPEPGPPADLTELGRRLVGVDPW